MTRQNVQIFLVAVLLIGVAGVAAAQTEELVRTIPMEPGGRFTLGNISGEITVTGVDGDDLTIRATKRVAGRGSAAADALDRVEIDIEERGNRVVVETDYPRHRRSFLQSLASLLRGGERVPFVAVDYLVTVPRDTGVAIESFDGDVTVEGVDGETHVKTVSGDGRLASLARLVAVETFSGNLEIADVRSDDVLTAETVSGRIDIEGVRAPRPRGEVLRRRGGAARGRVPARRGGDGIGIGDLRRRARCRRPVRAARGEVLRRRGGARRGRVPARRGGDGIGIGDLRRCAGSRRPVRITVALGRHPPDAAGRLGIRAGRGVIQRRPAFRHSHPRRPGRPVPPHARLRGRAPRDSRDRRRRRPA